MEGVYAAERWACQAPTLLGYPGPEQLRLNLTTSDPLSIADNPGTLHRG